MKHPVVVLLERSEQLFRGMGQEGRGVSRVTEHVGEGGGGGQALIQGPLLDKASDPVFLFNY